MTFRIFDDSPYGDVEGGSRCSMGGPVSGNTLTLAPPGEDRCLERGFV